MLITSHENDLDRILEEAAMDWRDRTDDDALMSTVSWFPIEAAPVDDALFEAIYTDLVAIADMEGHPCKGGKDMRKYFVRRILHHIVRKLNATTDHKIGVSAQFWMEYPPSRIQGHRSLMITSQITGEPVMDVDVRVDMMEMADALGQCVMTTSIIAIQQTRDTVFALATNLSRWWFVRNEPDKIMQRSTVEMRFDSHGYPDQDDLRAVIGAITTVVELSIEDMQTINNDSVFY